MPEAYTRPDIPQSRGTVHVRVKPGSSKPKLGRALCGGILGLGSRTTLDKKELTCRECKRRLPRFKEEKLAELLTEEASKRVDDLVALVEQW